MFFLYKEGMYGHGVYWIGTDVEEGKRRADEGATNDCDDYHEWILYQFVDQGVDGYVDDPSHIQIYQGVRTS
jgi:hypothetical protein